MLVGISGCKIARQPQSDPRLDFFYAAASVQPSEAAALDQLHQVEISADAAELGAVVRDIAAQAGLSLIYPQDWQDKVFSGDLKGPADVVLDAISRLYDVRFTYQNGVGFIGKPLPDDRSIGVIQTTFPEPDKIIQPLLSETGKVTSSAGWCFLSDRAEIILRVVRALKKVQPRTYCIQLLETFVDESQGGHLTISPSSTVNAYKTVSLFDRVIDAAISDSGAFVGRSWLAVVGEGRQYEQFLGQSEPRTKTTITSDNQVLTDTTYVQTGFKISYKVAASILSVQVSQDTTDNIQYKIDAELPGPGLYMVHQSDVKNQLKTVGFPSSEFKYRQMRRYIWVRYAELGTLSYGAPVPSFYDRKLSVGAPAADRPQRQPIDAK